MTRTVVLTICDGMNKEGQLFRVKKVSGSFHFYFTTDGSVKSTEEGKSNTSGSGYLTIDPHFTTKEIDANEDITEKGWDIDGVVLQTFIPKNLGYFNEWDSRLQTAKEGKYNMIHFTPFQELGYSGSAYSLRDQLKVNPNFTPPGAANPVSWSDIEAYLKHLERDWSVLSMTDLVFNHTCNDSPWLHEHPECAFNVVNSPHLVPAYLMDTIVWQLSIEISRGNLSHRNLPPKLTDASKEIPAMRDWLRENIERARLEEYFMADINAVQKEFIDWLMSNKSDGDFKPTAPVCDESLVLKVAGPRCGRRFGGTVDFNLARRMFVGVNDHSMPFTEPSATASAERLRHKLTELNDWKRGEMINHIHAAIDNVIANAQYRIYDDYGPKLSTITTDSPVMWRYFYQPHSSVVTVAEAEAVLTTSDAPRIMAFNGWVMNYNPLRNFAESDSHVYLRRELVVWGDSVKLRFGEKPEDCPYLWKRISDYAELTARICHAVRLDNCHSTPLVVAQYMLDRARKVRPNLYVVAELFTDSEYQDNIFINKLGLNSLIRESLQTHNAQLLGSQLYRFGVTRPAGAFFTHLVPQHIYPSVAHALLYDQTHDNESVAEKHCVYNFLPLAALASLTNCAIGSTRGYDELVPHNIDVVNEKRLYAKWPENVNQQLSLVAVKAVLNELHVWLSYQGFTEMFVDQCSPNVIAITRICPRTRESVLLVAHTAFNYDVVNQGRVDFKPLEMGGRVNRILVEAQTTCNESHPGGALSSFKRNPNFINGLDSVRFSMLQNVDAGDSKMFRVERLGLKNASDRLHFHNFPPGSVVVVTSQLSESQEQAMCDLHSLMTTQFGISLHRPRMSIQMGHGDKAYLPHLPSRKPSIDHTQSVRMLLSGLTLIDFNRIMFRSEAEESSDDPRGGAYDIPGYGKLCYCGIQGISAILEEIRDKNDLGHAICTNLRNGNWLADYLSNRLCTLPKESERELSRGICAIGYSLRTLFAPLNELPRYLIPAYFETLVQSLSQLLCHEATLRMSSWISSGSSFVQRLAVASLQFCGFVGNCRLPPPTPLLPQDMWPRPDRPMGLPIRCSLAAGLPHFAEGMWRSWGRDTFISLRGCLLLTNRLEEASYQILSYASLVRHGLIPNLTGEGSSVHPRYNCRDAVWFWLYSIVCYENASANRSNNNNEEAETEDSVGDQQTTSHSNSTENKIAWLHSSLNSASLLNRPVWRWFPNDDSEGWPVEKPEHRLSLISKHVQPLHEIIQEVLQRHVTGIDYIERRAGPQLDEQMRPEGFHVTARVDPKTGFPQGGNPHNCGTWMDKMGSSENAHNRGVPATPRDGSAVELVGLAYAVIAFLGQASQNASNSNEACYPHAGVQLPDGKFYTWSDWLTCLKNSFEPAFWIPSDTTDASLAYNKGIYRDSVGSSGGFTDNQFRPNFLVTMVVAPQLFTPERAWGALELARERLVGPFGMRTLGSNDMAYRGDYHNDSDSSDFATSKGFNYHQGPEWLWPTGYYIRARLLFARILAKNPQHQSLVNMTIAESQNTLSRLDKVLHSTAWRSLPELTNSNGQCCHDSCPAQAWSVGCALEAVHDLLFPPPLPTSL